MSGVQLTVSRRDLGGAAVLEVQGDLDVATVGVLRAAVEEALGVQRLLVDLTLTTFIDSTGCRELVRAARGGKQVGTAVELVVPPDNWRVRRVVDFMQFGALLPVHDEAPPS